MAINLLPTAGEVRVLRDSEGISLSDARRSIIRRRIVAALETAKSWDEAQPALVLLAKIGSLNV